MKKIYQKLFSTENPKTAVAFMSIIYVAAHFFIKFAFNAKEKVFFNDTYFTVDCPTSIIYHLEKIEWLQWLCLVVAIVGYIVYILRNGGLGQSEGSKDGGYAFLAGALIVIAGFFPAIFGQNKEEYRKKLDEPTFQYYKANPEKVGELFTK
jgi:hypothetical protein